MTKTKAKSARRGRPRNDGRPPLNRDVILEVAQFLFSSQGYAGTSIRQIAKKLDVFPASIQYHFATKELILDAIFCEGFKFETTHFEDILASKSPPEEQLYIILYNDLFDVASRQMQSQRLFLLPEVREGKFPAAMKIWNQLCLTYKNLLDQGIKARTFSKLPSRLMAEHCFALSTTVLISNNPEMLGTPRVQATVGADMMLRALLVDTNRLVHIKKRARRSKYLRKD